MESKTNQIRRECISSIFMCTVRLRVLFSTLQVTPSRFAESGGFLLLGGIMSYNFRDDSYDPPFCAGEALEPDEEFGESAELRGDFRREEEIREGTSEIS